MDWPVTMFAGCAQTGNARQAPHKMAARRYTEKTDVDVVIAIDSPVYD
jgi:hypothetical protein